MNIGIKVSLGALIALRTVMYLALHREGGLESTGAVAEALGASRDHVAKLLQLLVRAGVVRSTRGARGGFSLAKDPSELTALEVCQAIDGPIHPMKDEDPVSALFGEAGRKVVEVLSGATISSLIAQTAGAKSGDGRVKRRPGRARS
jgi:Rrf2 family transcriptional regulator, cysteine metabolism repressor